MVLRRRSPRHSRFLQKFVALTGDHKEMLGEQRRQIKVGRVGSLPRECHLATPLP